MSDGFTPAPKTIRPSSLTTAADCLRRFAAHQLTDRVAAAGYVINNPRPIHIGAAVGSSVHAAAAYTMLRKRSDGTLGSDAEAADAAQAEFDQRVEYGVSWDQVTDDLSTARKQIGRMTTAYRRNIAPRAAPVLVEDRLTADLGDGWTMSGQVDQMTGDPDAVLQDLKTGTLQRSNAVQYVAYGWIVKAHGYALRGIEEQFLKRVSLKKEQPPPLAIPIDMASHEADTWELIREIKMAADEFDRRVANPNGPPAPQAFRPNPASSLCSAKFCRAWGTQFCTAHRKA